PSFMSLAYLPSPGSVRLRLMARGENKKLLQEELDGQLHKLEHLIGTVIGGYEGDFSIQDKIAEKLTQTKQTIAFAESCTGGKITSLFTDIPGASAYLKGGFI